MSELYRLRVEQHRYRTDTNSASSWCVCRSSSFPGSNRNRRQKMF